MWIDAKKWIDSKQWIDAKDSEMTHDFFARIHELRTSSARQVALVAALLGALLLAGCATGRSVQHSVGGWFDRVSGKTPAASKPPAKAPTKKAAKAPAAGAAPSDSAATEETPTPPADTPTQAAPPDPNAEP